MLPFGWKTTDGKGFIEDLSDERRQQRNRLFYQPRWDKSSEHCFAGDDIMTLMTSSEVIGRNSHMAEVVQLVNFASVALDVDARMSIIFFSMKL